MKKTVLLFAVLAVAAALHAQEVKLLGAADLQQAFVQYNPAALEKAATDEAYADILTKLAAAYAAPDTQENRDELMAMAINFDNSMQLAQLRQEYFDGRTLARVSGTEQPALEEETLARVEKVVKSIFSNTLKVRKLQIVRCKDELKTVKKSAVLSAEEKAEAVAKIEKEQNSLKQEVKKLKKDSKIKIAETAKVYFGSMRADYADAQNTPVAL